MNLCILGHGLPSLLLAKILSNKNIKVSIFEGYKPKNKLITRTLGIAKYNLNYLKLEKIDLESAWFINNIQIFNDISKYNPTINFGSEKEKLFYIIKYNRFINLIKKNLKKNKFVKYIKRKNFIDLILNNKHNYDLIINFDQNNKISKNLFYKRITKNYNSTAFTTLIKHKKINNRIAYQVFTKLGPIAFLPCSEKETSIVYSIYKQNNDISNKRIIDLIKKYNNKYSIKSFSKVEKFDLIGSNLRNYFYKNILCFGDNIHRIHPLAGQGLNMTIRDIQTLSELIDQKINLGLCLDKSIIKEFENKTKHFNYIYSNGINFIYDFFKIENKFNLKLSNNIFKYLENNKLFKKYSIIFANEGIK